MSQAEFYWSHPPRCLAGFEVQRTPVDGLTFDGHGEEINTLFKINCPCSHGRSHVLGYYWRNPNYANSIVFIGPVALRCDLCGEITELIDTEVHGYDAECGHGSATRRGEGERAEFRCEKCGASPMEVSIRFEYPDDLFNADFKTFRGREQDLFTWVTILGKCCSCSRKDVITEFECA
jgi:hypothetical protein